MSEEIWLPIAGYEGSYEVSNLGRVRTLDRVASRRRIAGGVMKTFIAAHYEHVKLSSQGKKKAFKIHRLVAIAFIPNPANKPEVNHIDGCKTNNIANNLEWVTREENISHGYQTGLIVASRGVDHCHAKLTAELIRQAIELKSMGHSCTYIAKIIGVTRGHAWKIVNRVQWKHLS